MNFSNLVDVDLVGLISNMKWKSCQSFLKVLANDFHALCCCQLLHVVVSTLKTHSFSTHSKLEPMLALCSVVRNNNKTRRSYLDSQLFHWLREKQASYLRHNRTFRAGHYDGLTFLQASVNENDVDGRTKTGDGLDLHHSCAEKG